MVKCNVPLRGWQNGVGGCPNVGGICMACTMPGFPDKYMPFMDEDPTGRDLVRHRAVHLRAAPALRAQAVHRRKYDIEPEWRHNRAELTTGYQKRW